MKRWKIFALALGGLAALLLVAIVAAVMGGKTGEQRRAAEQYAKWSARFVHEATRLGLLKDGPRIEEFVMHCPGATPDQAMTAFFNVVQGCPEQRVERQIGVAGHAAKLAFMMDEQHFAELCRLCGIISQMAPDKPDDDPVDMAVMIFQNFNKFTGAGPSEKAIRGVTYLLDGASVEEAWAIALTAAKNGDKDGATVYRMG